MRELFHLECNLVIVMFKMFHKRSSVINLIYYGQLFSYINFLSQTVLRTSRLAKQAGKMIRTQLQLDRKI